MRQMLSSIGKFLPGRVKAAHFTIRAPESAPEGAPDSFLTQGSRESPLPSAGLSVALRAILGFRARPNGKPCGKDPRCDVLQSEPALVGAGLSRAPRARLVVSLYFPKILCSSSFHIFCLLLLKELKGRRSLAVESSLRRSKVKGKKYSLHIVRKERTCYILV